MTLPPSLEVRALARERGAALCRVFDVPALCVWTTWAGFASRELEAWTAYRLGRELAARLPFYHRARSRLLYR